MTITTITYKLRSKAFNMKPNMKIFDSMKSQNNVIEIKSLKKFYGKSRGVTDLSFEVGPGEFFGFIGPTVPVNQPQSGC